MMSWTDAKDIMLLREMGASGIFEHKAGSRERGRGWQTIAESLNCHENFEVTNRSMRDRFNLLSKRQKAKTAKELKGTGLGGGEPTEMESLIEELIVLSEESDKKAETEAETAKAEVDAERKKALNIRTKAMETMGQTKKRLANEEGEDMKEKKTRRTGSDVMNWLKEKSAREAELREKELENHRQEREVKIQERSEQTDLLRRQLELQTETQRQQQQQQNVMQQQFMAVIQQQQQQMQLFMEMFMKSKN